MLHFETVEPNTLTLLTDLQSLSELNEMYLVGGTALSLYYGHRKSIDLDLFGPSFNKTELLYALKRKFKKIEFVDSSVDWGLFCFINEVKVDFVRYNHKLLEMPMQFEELRLYSVNDIAAMKVNAILRRGTKKDFWDIRELLRHFSLSELIDFFERKFPDERQLISIPQALAYFDDAEASPDPICLKDLKWADVKKDIQKTIRDYLS